MRYWEEIGITPEQNARWNAVREEMEQAGLFAIFWNVNDVKSIRPDLSTEQAKAVLKEVVYDHDGNRGICWDDLGYAADALFPREQAKQAILDELCRKHPEHAQYIRRRAATLTFEELIAGLEASPFTAA